MGKVQRLNGNGSFYNKKGLRYSLILWETKGTNFNHLCDKQYGDWLNIWNELTQEPGHQIGYDNMVGNTFALTGTALDRAEATTLYVPLQFWFCRNPGLALPLIA